MFTSSQVLLTTCVGSKEELEMLVTAASQFYAKYYQHSGSATPAKVSDIVNMRRMIIMIREGIKRKSTFFRKWS